jgi:hypothetical protein
MGGTVTISGGDSSSGSGSSLIFGSTDTFARTEFGSFEADVSGLGSCFIEDLLMQWVILGCSRSLARGWIDIDS